MQRDRENRARLKLKSSHHVRRLYPKRDWLEFCKRLNRSNTDEKNFSWFGKDNTRATLAYIALVKGKVRGLASFEAEFEYPISVFAGSNGSGKSTLLALAACAFHNKTSGFIPPLRSKTYYTFSDFFFQSVDETPVDGVKIDYGIRYNKWYQKKPGLRYQSRYKSKGGRWNDYSTRVKRNVIYFGVQRVVPHFERSASKSYRSRFKPGNLPDETRKRITEIASRIIGKAYQDFNNLHHSKYSLPMARSAGITYSGFNMGAGESAIFEILIALFCSGEGSLLVIDEIELGLHESAQKRMIEELKILCKDLKCQIICSTHSYAVLNSLPPEARFFIESVGASTLLTSGISADFACGKMGKADAEELDIFVEDECAAVILQEILSLETRKRCRIKPIGSQSAVLRQLASRFVEGIDDCMCVLDGDQSMKLAKGLNIVVTATEASSQEEKDAVKEWATDRVFFLPGDTWPENWLLDEAIDVFTDDLPIHGMNLPAMWGLKNKDELLNLLEDAKIQGSHKEFFELSKAVKLDLQCVRQDVCRLVATERREKFSNLISTVEDMLP